MEEMAAIHPSVLSVSAKAAPVVKAVLAAFVTAD
jgi:hypothetical protein